MWTIFKEILSEFRDVSEGLGNFQNPYHITLEEHEPGRQPARRVSYTFRHCLKYKVDKMERQCVIKKIDQPTEWACA